MTRTSGRDALGRWAVLRWGDRKLSLRLDQSWRPFGYAVRDRSCSGRLAVGVRFLGVMVNVHPIQTEAEAAAPPPKPFDGRARAFPRRRGFAWTSRALAAAWLGVAWLALGAAFVADAAQKGLATVGIAVAIALAALGLAIGN